MIFEIVGEITDVETIATGPEIRVLRYLRRAYGRGRWRKLKGTAAIRLPNGTMHQVRIALVRSTWKGKNET